MTDQPPDKPIPGHPGRPGHNARPLPKRFYKAVSISTGEATHRLLLDGRGAKTPSKRDLAVASKPLAEQLAAEWAAQGLHIDPATMPLTRLVCTAIDAVQGQEAAVREDVAKYAASDLLCYRADGPDGLVALQSRHWTPVLAWAETELGARFAVAEGLMPVRQPPGSAAKIAAAIAHLPTLPLAAVHVLTTLLGSAILAVAVAKQHLTIEAAWSAAHIDEEWQISQWGTDAEAVARRKQRWSEARAAADVLAAH